VWGFRALCVLRLVGTTRNDSSVSVFTVKQLAARKLVRSAGRIGEFVIADAIRIERIGDLPAMQVNNESVDNLFANFEEILMDDLLAV